MPSVSVGARASVNDQWLGNGGHVAPLDGLRGCAILLVLIRHLTDIHGTSAVDRVVVRYVLGAGWCGVDLFFVLSGFLITGILVRTKESSGYLRNFFVRRVLRIFPLYIVYLVVRFGILPRLSAGWVTPTHVQLWFWTYLSNVYFAIVHWAPDVPLATTHLWSLAVEEQFYLFWPLCVLLCTRRQMIVVATSFVVGAPLLRIICLALGVHPVAIYVLTPTRIDTLAAGALIALLATDEKGRAWMSRWAAPIGAIAAAGVIVAAVLDGSGDDLGRWMQIIGFSCFALLFSALVVATLSGRLGARVAGMLSRGVLPTMGRYSYSMYLFHMLVVYLLTRVGFAEAMQRPFFGSQLPGYVVYAIVGCAMTLAVAALTWFTFERHFLNLKDRIARYGAPPSIAADPEFAAP